MSSTRTLFRPVGLKEAELILKADSRAFPPRLPGQPIFYPILNQEYASQIAREWNAPKEPHFAGFVTRFEIDADYSGQFEERVVGSSRHREFWVPAEQLEEFNRHIVGRIELVEAHYGNGYQGPIPISATLKGKRVDEQLRTLTDGATAISEEKALIQLNFAWWVRAPAESQGLDVRRKGLTLKQIVETLKGTSPDFNLLMA